MICAYVITNDTYVIVIKNTVWNLTMYYHKNHFAQVKKVDYASSKIDTSNRRFDVSC